MGFKPPIAEKALLASGRHCSICHKFCGSKIELHHIVQKKNKGEDSFDNCIPLCFDCHADVMQYNPEHPKGKKYTTSELKKHRDNWYEKVKLSGGTVISNSNYSEIDKATFYRLTNLLPSDKLMLFIKQKGFVCGSFPDEIMTQILIFLGENDLPEFEFIDADLEGLKSELVSHFFSLNQLIHKNTFDAGPERQGIPNEWEYQDPERFENAIDEFSKLTPQITKTYEALIKLGRRKLFTN